jgi:hypothetical protein
MKRWATALSLAFVTVAGTAAGTASAADGSIAGITGVGVHNAYEQGTFPYLVDALESGASMLEIDVWQNFLGSGSYQVSHNPGGNANNCSSNTSYDGLRAGSRNQNLQACLRNIKLWHDRRPDHAPLIVKFEMKNGFDGRGGYGPGQFDTLLTSALGAQNILKPADVRGGHATLDAAVRAGGWPSRDSLRGKFLFLVETGAYESQNPFDSYHTDLEYADHLNGLADSGRLGSATMFTTINGASSSDPRTGNRGGNRAKWYVTFDGNASSYVGGDTSFYTSGKYLLVMTDAHSVAPAIDGRNPTVQQATDRVRQLAGRGATIASSDWSNPAIVSQTFPRG